MSMILACSGKDDDAVEVMGELGNGETYALVNGNAFEVPAGGTSGLLFEQTTNGFYTYTFTITSAIDLNASGSDRNLLIITLLGEDPNDLKSGNVWQIFGPDQTEIKGVGGAYVELRNEEFMVSAGSDPEVMGSAKFKLTTLNMENRTLSGEFNFIAQDEFSDKTYTVTNGRFNNVSYFEN